MQPIRSQPSGAALISTLVILSIIAVVSISYLAITTKQAEVSGTLVSSSRASLGEQAALADATSLLESLTSQDDYLVSVATPRNTDQGNQITRYTFITVPGESTTTHYPLFAGGKIEESATPNLNQTETSILASTSIEAPEVDLDPSSPAEKIEISPLTHLNAAGQLEKESNVPPTGFIELSSASNLPYATRYTFWIEDLEGYPNMDTSGIWSDQFASPLNGGHLNFARLGFSSVDPRVTPSGSESGVALSLNSDPETSFQFPATFRGQLVTGQLAPGLSTREITVMPWNAPDFGIEDHPFFPFARFASLRNSNFTPPSTSGEQRFSNGLVPYRTTPLIPYGHDYADQGGKRFPLNQLVANKDMTIATIIETNLPEFESRKGGFPPGENYLYTLAANAIDYADSDDSPSTNGNTTNSGSEVFRGVDSYAPVNEFFVRFEYQGYQDLGNQYRIIFVATPYAEFWNPFNHPAKLTDATLGFEFLETIRFRANSEWHPIEESDLVSNDALNVPADIDVPPNGYYVHQFGDLRWEVDIDADPSSPIAFPIVQDIRGQLRSSTRANYELLIEGEKVDSCGRQAGPDALIPDFGFFFSRYSSAISPGEHFMRMTTPALSGRAYGFGSGFGSHLGDPWMVYYSRATADGTIPPSYKTKATPGSRNFDHDKVGSSRQDWYKDQARVRDWPDRGYDPATGPSPSNDDELPTGFSAPSEPGKAPWRISNTGRFFSVTELGNLHDPVMWVYGPSDPTASPSVVGKQSEQLFSEYRDSWLRSLPEDAEPGSIWGGGNTLRIGRPEHAKFDQPGMRASQLLDLFHVGVNGTNLLSPGGAQDDDLYHFYDPRDHQPLPSGLDATEAASHPFNHLYEPDLHAQSPFRYIDGHLNINSVPTQFEIETLLRGPFASSWFRLLQDHYETPTYTSADQTGILASGLSETEIPNIARDLYAARPYYSPSHLARVFSHLLEKYDALPSHHNDAEAEESFARLFNTTSLSSRHFRIYTYAETYHATTNEVVARKKSVYSVFLRPEHAADGSVQSSNLQILTTSEL